MKEFKLLVIGASSLLFACSSQEGTSVNTPNTSQKPITKSLAHGSSGKIGAPVAVSHQLLDTPSLGIPLRIRVRMTPLLAASEIKLEYTLSVGLISADPSPRVVLDVVATGQVADHVISVVPQVDGQHHINVFVTLVTQDGQSQSTAVMIPIQVGAVGAVGKLDHPDKVYIQQNSLGERIISVPAEETRQ